MKVSREKVAEQRQTVLDAAGRLFRERGFADVSVAEVMKAAGLTHGAFYGYFASKEDLVAAAIAELTARRTMPENWPETLATYLSAAHRDHAAQGCPIAGLCAEAARGPASARSAITEGIARMIAEMSVEAPGEDEATRRRAGVAATAAMVGAIMLARAVDDAGLSDEILASTRDLLSSVRPD